MDIELELSKILNQSNAAPILFVGSGMTKRYIGTESWPDLLNYFSGPLKMEYKFYESKAKKNLPKTASLMADEFYEIWWSEDDYLEQRDIYKDEIINVDSPLKVEISCHLSSYDIIEDTNLLNEIKLLKEISKNSVVDTIITTNWDRFLEEEIFTDYDVLIGQDELLASKNIQIEEIHKIHGCVSNPNSLILTEEDYDKFIEKNAYMSAKLLTTFIEHPVIFLGYSLTDTNIQRILVNIGKCIPHKFVNRLQYNLIFIQPIFDENNPDSITRSSLTIDNVNIPRVVVDVCDYSKVYSALLSYKRKFPTKLVKLMENQLYNIIIDNNPNNQIIAGDIADLSQISNADFVVGIGINDKLEEAGVDLSLKGILGLEYNDILDDVIRDHIVNEESNFVHGIVKNILPKKPYYPLYKFLYYGNYIFNTSEYSKLDERIQQRAEKSYEETFICKTWTKKSKEIQSKYNSIEEIIADKKLEERHKIIYIPLLKPENIRLEELKEYIENNQGLLHNDSINYLSHFRKLIKLYDWLKYRNKVIVN